jgi:hypothetical protein
LVDIINDQNTKRLNTYNNLIIKLQNIDRGNKTEKNKKLDLEIQEYLKNINEINNSYNQIKQSAMQQDNYIDFIVSHV